MKITSTPWGPPQQQHENAEGITIVCTARHGGIHLSPVRWADFTALFPTFKPFAGAPWLEEDCDCALAALAFPTAFSTQTVANAVDMVASNYGGYFNEAKAWLATPAAQRVRSIHEQCKAKAGASPSPIQPPKQSNGNISPTSPKNSSTQTQNLNEQRAETHGQQCTAKTKHTTMKILGYEWEQIQRAQQGDKTALHGHITHHDTPEEMKAKLESEMERFGIFVHKSFAEAYKVTIPEHYTLDGDHYKPKV